MVNYNILAYLLYGVGTVILIYYLGKYFHKHGRVYLLALFENNSTFADSTNNLLLILYYLLNMGYAILQFAFWDTIHTFPALLSSLTTQFAYIILLLGIIHYINIFTLYMLSSKKSIQMHS